MIIEVVLYLLVTSGVDGAAARSRMIRLEPWVAAIMCYVALFLAIYHLGYIAPAKLLYSKGAISIFSYIATCYTAVLCQLDGRWYVATCYIAPLLYSSSAI